MKLRHAAVLALVLTACADRTAQYEHALVMGAGGAVEAELPSGHVSSGSNVFVEYEAIDNWLELELGVSVFPQHDGAEVSGDLLFKKPFQLTENLELMVGAGPEIVRAIHSPDSGTFGGGETAADFMYWPSRHMGFWMEPSYDFVFRDGLSHGIGTTGGVIFGW